MFWKVVLRIYLDLKCSKCVLKKEQKQRKTNSTQMLISLLHCFCKQLFKMLSNYTTNIKCQILVCFKDKFWQFILMLNFHSQLLRKAVLRSVLCCLGAYYIMWFVHLQVASHFFPIHLLLQPNIFSASLQSFVLSIKLHAFAERNQTIKG